jgi:hypothetical protein
MKVTNQHLIAALIVSCAASNASAEVAPVWESWVDQGQAIISFQAPNTDHVLFTVVCDVSTGRGRLRPGGNAVGVKAGQQAQVIIRGPGGEATFRGTAVLNEMDDTVDLDVTLASAWAALPPLSKPGVLTIQYPTSSYTISLDAKTADALTIFRANCPRSK